MDTPCRAARLFAPTRWSVVLSAGQGESLQAREALAWLCQTYWYPLYAYVRRQGHAPPDAQDLTQAFLARLLEKQSLARISPEGGRFRSFLLTALKRFLANEWDRARAQKRGGQQTVISIDQAAAESQYRLEPAHELTAEAIYEQRWAQTLLNQVMSRLREEYVRTGKEALLEQISGCLIRPRGAVPYAEIARRLDTTEAAIKMAVQRLRSRYRDLLRAEIAHTVATPQEVEEEIRHLFTIFAR